MGQDITQNLGARHQRWILLEILLQRKIKIEGRDHTSASK
jgi:hypothetical protein